MLSSDFPKKRRQDRSYSESDGHMLFKQICSHDHKKYHLVVDYPSEQESSIRIFLKHHSCYDLIPTNSKLVVLDDTLNVQKAFYALIVNGLRAGVLWSNVTQSYTGMLTITDFIQILVHFYRSGRPIEELDSHMILSWRKINTNDIPKSFIHISADCTLLEATIRLLRQKIHRLPVVNPMNGDVLHILSHKRILKYIMMNITSLPNLEFLANKRLKDVKLGSFMPNCITARSSMPLIDALRLFLQYKISCLPIIEPNSGKLTDIYTKFDVINLAIDKSYTNLDVPLKTSLEHCHINKSSINHLIIATMDNSILQVMKLLADSGVHRILIVDQDLTFLGIVSLSDVLNFCLKPLSETRDQVVTSVTKTTFSTHRGSSSSSSYNQDPIFEMAE